MFIAVSIFTFIGLQFMVRFLVTGNTTYSLAWHLPLSIILTAVLCSLPSLILYRDEKLAAPHYLLHYVCVAIIVAIAGWLFDWYQGLGGLVWLMLIYTVIYSLTWLMMSWMSAAEDKKINQALEAMREEA